MTKSDKYNIIINKETKHYIPLKADTLLYTAIIWLIGILVNSSLQGNINVMLLTLGQAIGVNIERIKEKIFAHILPNSIPLINHIFDTSATIHTQPLIQIE